MGKLFQLLIIILINNITCLSLKAQIPFYFSSYNPKSEVKVKKTGIDLIRVEWNAGSSGRYALNLNLKKGSSLFKSLESDTDNKGSMTIIATDLNPRFDVTIGTRDPQKKWPYIFFDKVDLRPFTTYQSDISIHSLKIVSEELTRVKIILSKMSAGSFSGDLVIRVYSGSPLIHIIAEMKMPEPGIAYIYDGLLCGTFDRAFYKDNKTDRIVSENPSFSLQSKTVRHRTIMAGFPNGTLALFPPPHAFIYPLDFSDNYGFVQTGMENGLKIIGIKSQPNGDNRYRPWIDAPKDKIQQMGFFLLLSTKEPEFTLEQVKRYTHNDTYKEIPGYITFANHFHAAISMTDSTKNPSGPKFRDAMLALNVKAVEVAEFHGDGNPRDTGLLRLKQMKKMFDVCKKYSVPGSLVIIPGEEPNAHFAGHTMYFFPKPVYLTLRKGLTQPYKEMVPGYGEVFHAGNEIDIYNIYRDNGGIVWTSHPRIKGSENTPDLFINHPTFQDDNVFFGGDWKAMPLDLSEDRLGVRALNLLNDFNQLGFRKGILGEVDPFKIDTSHELYAHMNINYVKISSMPTVDDWSQVFNAIKDFDFFTSTGEVLIHSWSVSPSKDKVTAELDWTFPMAYSEVTWSEGDEIKTQKFSLIQTKEFINTPQHYEWPVDLRNAKWVRFEAWDIAKNGAFTQTIWLKPPSRSLTPIIYNYTLINGENGYPFPEYDPIREGDTIRLGSLNGIKSTFIRANLNLMATINVSFVYDEIKENGIVRSYPYSIPINLTEGKHVLTGMPYIESNYGSKKVLQFVVTK